MTAFPIGIGATWSVPSRSEQEIEPHLKFITVFTRVQVARKYEYDAPSVLPWFSGIRLC